MKGPDYTERRREPRYPVRQDVTLKAPGVGLPSWGEDEGWVVQTASSRDISASGIYLYVRERITNGSKLEVLMSLPHQIRPNTTVNLRCTGKVVRIDHEASRDTIGVAIAFDDVEVMD